MSTKLPVLTIGLSPAHWSVPTHPEMLSGQFDPKKLGPELKAMGEALAKSPYQVESYFCGPKEDLVEIGEKLKEKEWKAVLIGWGIRGHPEMTATFEQLIALAHTNAPQAVLCFNTSPASTIESLERNLPVA